MFEANTVCCCKRPYIVSNLVILCSFFIIVRKGHTIDSFLAIVCNRDPQLHIIVDNKNNVLPSFLVCYHKILTNIADGTASNFSKNDPRKYIISNYGTKPVRFGEFQIRPYIKMSCSTRNVGPCPRITMERNGNIEEILLPGQVSSWCWTY